MTKQTTVDNVPRLEIGKLKPYKNNARVHSDDQIARLVASIQEFGWTRPIIVDEKMMVLAGHGCLEAAKAMGEETVPVIVKGGLTAKQKRAYVLADNKLAEHSKWDEDLLRIELQGLGVELAELTGFSLNDISDILGPDTEKDPDEAPELPEKAVSVVGDVYTLGNHRLVVGDCRDHAVLQALMEGKLADMVWTDPPYNVSYGGAGGDAANKNKVDGGKRNTEVMLNDSMDDKDFYAFLLGFYSAAYAVLKQGGAIYVAHADTEGVNFRTAFLAAGFKLSGCIIWRKDSLVLGRSDYQWQHEPILYGWKPGAKHCWYGGRKNTTIVDLGNDSPFVEMPDGTWQITIGDRVMVVSGAERVYEVVPSVMDVPRPKRNDIHPTMKPVELVERMLRNNARPGALILDPFGGSGSTLIAADRLGMSARLVELDPKYADVIVTRWEEWSGKTAVKL